MATATLWARVARRGMLALAILGAITGTMMIGATVASAQELVIPIWPGVAPGSENWTQKETEIVVGPRQEHIIRNVIQPSMTAFFPKPGTATGTAVIVCPGGGFAMLSWNSEGTKVAQWLSDRGVAAFVLKYRLKQTAPSDPLPGMPPGARPSSGMGPTDTIPPELVAPRALAVADALQAMKIVRQRAGEWGIAPNRIGLMGFSAGAVVTTGVLQGYDASTRPDFAAPIYGISLDASKVPADAPPIFIVCADDDPLLPSTGSSNLYAAWRTTGHSAELHIYSKGSHGFGLSQRGLPVDHWIDAFGQWLDVQGLLKPVH